MAVCVFSRYDSLDTTDTATHGKYASTLIWDETVSRILGIWIERGSVRFARFDPATNLPDSEVAVFSYTANNTVGSIDLIRMSDGRLVAVWYAGSSGAFTNQSVASESSDGGATWTATPVAISGTNEQVIGVYDNGTNIIAVVGGISSGGVGTGDLKAYKRTAVDTWSAVSTRFYDSGGAGGTPGAVDTNQLAQMHHSMRMTSATVGCIVVCRATDGANNTRRITAFTTTDGFATGTAVDLITFTANAGGTVIYSLTQASGRFWVLFANPDDSSKPRLAYSDDVGSTWTVLATPTAISDEMTALGVTSTDPSFDLAMALDLFDNILIFHSTRGVVNPGTHVVYRSVDPTADSWVIQGTCTYTTSPTNWSTIATGRGVVTPSDGTLHRLTTRVHSTPTHYELEFLSIEGLPPESPEPEIPPPAVQSGLDDNNMMWRINTAEGRGWGLHTLGPACFLSWDEGDLETGREVPIVVYGNASIDPAIQDPALISGFRRFETGSDEGFGFRTYVEESADVIGTRNDPLRFLFRSKDFLIEKDIDRNVCRQAGLIWMFDAPEGITLRVDILVDNEKLNRSIFLPTTFGLKKEEWFSLPTAGNVGSMVKFLIDDESVYNLWIDCLGISYIPKGRRS